WVACCFTSSIRLNQQLTLISSGTANTFGITRSSRWIESIITSRSPLPCEGYRFGLRDGLTLRDCLPRGGVGFGLGIIIGGLDLRLGLLLDSGHGVKYFRIRQNSQDFQYQVRIF
ncbi:MAG: hypothetical protein ACI82Z_000926, partial [Cellvibrionaceae bacterium]